MADYVEVTPGTGEQIAADLVTGGPADGLKVQRVKAGFGTDGTYADVSPAAGLPVATAPAAGAAPSSVAASVTSVPLLAANAARRGASFYNDSASAYLYIKLGATASLTSFAVRVPPGGLYEVLAPVWQGAIDGIWSAAVGSARIVELT